MQENKLPELITIDGVEHKVADLGEKSKHLLSIYQMWSQDVANLRIDLAKNEAALRDLTREITFTIKTEKDEIK